MGARQGWRLTRTLVSPPGGSKDWVDLAKGVAILAVILYHCMLFQRSVGLDVGGMGRLKTVLEMLPMPVFIALAGMFHARVVEWTLGDTWRRRLLGYAYLYLVWSVVRFAFYALVPNVRGDGAGATAQEPLYLLLAPVWPTSSYWFIWALFALTLLLWLVRGAAAVPVVSVAAAVSALVSAGLMTSTNVGWDRVLEYAVYFLAGALWSKQLFTAVSRSPWWTPLAGLAVWGTFAAVAAYVPYGSRVPGVAMLGQVGAVVACCTAARQLVRLRPLSWLSYLGARSLHLYLVHIFVIAVLCAVLVALRDRGALPLGPLAVLAAMLVTVTLLSVLLGRVLSRFRWLFVPPRALTGRKRPPAAPSATSSSAPAPRAASPRRTS
ncbi:acyltransferase [Streptomyces sp. NP160]|uniref:acyltransferase family protein n=1 Tax=Streptomyces sp. NP160 TaxID=2586637 RepID=UPI0015D5D9AA|nr:acyltransferase [Streptomyces sp. NP160]